MSCFKYSGVGRRWKGGSLYVETLDASFLIDTSASSLELCDFIFASLFPIKSGCGGAGRAGIGTGFRVPANLLPAMLRGNGFRVEGRSCSFGGLAVDPLDFSNLSSDRFMLRSLFSDRLRQISVRGGDGVKLDFGLATLAFGVVGAFVKPCWLRLSFGGSGGERASNSPLSSESFALLLPLSEKPLRDNAGEAEYEDDISGEVEFSQFLTAAWTLPTGRRVIVAAMLSFGSGGSGELGKGGRGELKEFDVGDNAFRG